MFGRLPLEETDADESAAYDALGLFAWLFGFAAAGVTLLDLLRRRFL